MVCSFRHLHHQVCFLTFIFLIVVFVSVVLLLVIICSSSRAEGASTFVYGFMIRAMFVRYSPVFVSINIETGAISSIGTLGAWIQPSSCTFGGNADSTFYATGLIIDKDVNAVLSIGLSSSGSSNIGIFPLSQIPTSTSLESGITGSSTFLYRRHGGSYWNYTKGTSNVVYGGEFPSCSNSPNCMQLIDSKRNEIWTPQGVQSGPQGLVYSINVKNYQYGYQRNITMGSHYWQGFILNPLDSCLYGIYQSKQNTQTTMANI